MHQRSDIRHCPIVVGELYFGAETSNDTVNQCHAVEQLLQPHASLPYGEAEAKMYARIRADLEHRGLPIGSNDTMIAAIALVHGVTLVTHNVREFSRVPGLLIEDWQTP